MYGNVVTDIKARDFRARIDARKREKCQALRAFVQAISDGDVMAFGPAVCAVDSLCLWRQAANAAARISAAPQAIREEFVSMWLSHGDHIRLEAGGDIVLIKALHALLPPYAGGAVVLFRGDSFLNRRRRTYGMSWTTRRDIAEGFARGMWRTCDGGSVVLTTEAPPEAVICAPAGQDAENYDEAEYIVDRRMLGRVHVVERCSQLAIDDCLRACEDRGSAYTSPPAKP